MLRKNREALFSPRDGGVRRLPAQYQIPNPSVAALNVILLIFSLFCGDTSPFSGGFGENFILSSKSISTTNKII